MAKISDFSNHNIFAYMLASCANLNFHPVKGKGTQGILTHGGIRWAYRN